VSEALWSDLNDYGIVTAAGLFNEDQISAINRGLDPHFEALSGQPRSYAYSNQLQSMGVLDQILNDRVVASMHEVIPDPVLYHLHCYEIGTQQTKPHIFGNELRGWHRDPDSGYEPARPSHVSLFVHLTDVGPGDGAFEFMPHSATRAFVNKVPACSMLGPKGTSFYWNRHFFHRASPNRGSTRRRMLKISIQSSRWPSSNLSLDHLAPVVEAMRDATPAVRGLFGHPAEPRGAGSSGVAYRRVPTNLDVDIGAAPLLRSRLKALVLRRPTATEVAYEA